MPVKGLGNVSAISASISHSLALTSEGELYAWGSNRHGELGVRARASCAGNPCSKVAVPVMGAVSAISAGYGFSEAISAGQAFSWGWNEDRQLGNGSNVDTDAPAAIPSLGGATAISAGEYHSLALTGGSAPAPALQAIPGEHSLEVRWPAGAGSARWTLAYRPVAKPEGTWSSVMRLSGSSDSHAFTGLAAGTYEVMLRREGFGTATTTASPLS